MSLLLPAAPPLTPDRTTQKIRFNFPDGLRGLAAIWVMGQHLWVDQHTPQLFQTLPAGLNRVLFQFGYLGVGIFFVLSGFFMAHALRRTAITRHNLGWLYARRWLRLSPAYYAAIGLAIGCSAIVAAFNGQTFIAPSFATLLKHFTYFQGLLPAETINGVYWTLCIEIQFYFAFCLLLGAIQWIDCRWPQGQFRRTVFWTIALLVTTLWPAQLWHSSGFEAATLLPYWYSCLLGAWIYWVWQKQQPPMILWGYCGLLAVITIQTRSLFVGVVLLTALSLSVAGAKDGLAHWLSWRWLQKLGQLSYAFYLVHEPLLKVLFPIEHRLLGAHLWVDIGGILLNFALCVGMAQLLHYYIEQPGIRWSQRVLLKP